MSALEELKRLEILFTAYRDNWKGRDCPDDLKPEDFWDAALNEIQRSIQDMEAENANG